MSANQSSRPNAKRRTLLVGGAALAGLASLAMPWAIKRVRQKHLSIGLHAWIGYETLYLASEFGWLPSPVTLLGGEDASDSMAALRSGAVDAACLTLDETLRIQAAGVPLAVALVFDVSSGADALYAQPDIRQASDLVGRRIGVERSATGALLLEGFLRHHDMDKTALSVVDMPPGRHLEAMQRSEVDAVVSYEPVAGQLQKYGARRLFDSRQMPNRIFDVLAVRRDRLDCCVEALQALTGAHFRALSHLRENRLDGVYRIAGRQKIDPEGVQRALAGITIPSYDANVAWLSGRDASFVQAARHLCSLMREMGLMAAEVGVEDLCTTECLSRPKRLST
ncbi:ABC transporter substrate-binding protein [Propionivibrio limicola]|uniref:ABC transporter substrate-binding protein n=1 Tax=Propionivibrio limicola TaxID=167645 RepID=UPI001291B79D|nr:ABC transporter substrate-binding protein [Propionivibrio limicola]